MRLAGRDRIEYNDNKEKDKHEWLKKRNKRRLDTGGGVKDQEIKHLNGTIVPE